MGTIKISPVGKAAPKENSLHINKNSGRIKAVLNTVKYRDKDTRQIVIYIPALEISGYGATEEKALEMVKFSMDEYFTSLVRSSAKEMERELAKYGWQHKNKFSNKEYSKAYIDADGKLQNFNAVGDEVEIGVLSY